MAIKITEAVEEQEFVVTKDATTAKQVFYVKGAGSVYQAITATDGVNTIPVIGQAYATRDMTDPQNPVLIVDLSLPCESVDCTNIDLEDDLHEITVSYQKTRRSGGSSTAPENPEDGDEYWVISSGGDTTQINTAIDTQAKYGKNAPEVSNYIGVSSDGEDISGVQVIDEVDDLTVTLYKTADDVTSTYINGLRERRGSVTGVAWYGAPAASTLFFGFNIEDYDTDLKVITFNFRVGKNKDANDLGTFKNKDNTNYQVDNGKNAWQYMWSMGKSKTGTSGELQTYNRGVWVADVYPTKDWTALGRSGSLT